jgi:hypothetical protein
MIFESLLTVNDSNIRVEPKVCNNVFSFDLPLGKFSFLELEVRLSSRIISFLNFDATWNILKSGSIIFNDIQPRLFYLENCQYFSPNCSYGTIILDSEKPDSLRWVFCDSYIKPIFFYSKFQNRKFFPFENNMVEVGFIFHSSPLPIFGITPKGFKSIIVFTDHCDFDNELSSEFELKVFNKAKIKITKGFFLKHYSKRRDNISFEIDERLLSRYLEHRHELGYHSLSQSIMSPAESKELFYNFQIPFFKPKVWIDHGFQPYNLTMVPKIDLNYSEWFDSMDKKGISIFWNYLDSLPAIDYLPNQLSASEFSQKDFFKFKNINFIEKIRLFLLYSNDESIVITYRNLAGLIKKSFFKNLIKILKSSIKIFFYLLGSIFKPSEKIIRNKFNPFVFSRIFNKKRFYFFQTVDLNDWINPLKPDRIDEFIKNHGVVILHTYNSSNFSYHKNRFFNSDESKLALIQDNLNYIGYKIELGEIWNPTITELVDYYSKFEDIRIKFNEFGVLDVNCHDDIYFEYPEPFSL